MTGLSVVLHAHVTDNGWSDGVAGCVMTNPHPTSTSMFAGSRLQGPQACDVTEVTEGP